MKGGTYILIVIISVMAVCLVIASGYEYLQARLAPMLVGGVIVILCVAELIKDLRARRAPATPPKEPAKVETREEFGSYQKEAAWMVGFFLGIYLVGFVVGIAAYTALYAKVHKARWTTSIILGVLTAGLSDLLFSYLGETELYPGIILQHLGRAGGNNWNEGMVE